jgi:serine protease Do
MSSRKTTLFYSLLIMVASLAVGMVIASRLELTPASSAQSTMVAAPPMNSAPLSGPVDASTFRNIAKTVSPAVVNIRSTSRQRAQEMTEFFGGGGGGDDLLERFFGGQGGRQQPRSRPREQETLSAGTGFVISRDGFILTNNHVVEGASKIEVAFFNEEADVYYEAKVIGRDPLTDSALIQLVDAKRDLTEVKFGDSAQMQPGDWVVAIGNPFGLGHTVSVGVISATRASGLPVAQQRRADVLQTDAAINPGNSGGPLLNARGEVIGVNTQIETGSGTSATGNVGIGFAVPSNTVKDAVAQILRTGRVDHAYLGISGQAVTEDVADNYNLPVQAGVLVESVTEDSGAGKAGLKGGKTDVVVAGQSYVLGGDIIVAYDGKKISSIEQLRDAIAGDKPGDKIKLVIYRDANKTSVTVTLGRQPASPQG